MRTVAGAEVPSSAPDRGTGRLRSLALGGLAAGAVLALVAGSRAWWRAAGSGVSVTFTGTEATGGLAQALALVVLAGALLGLVLRSRGRRVLGVLLVLTGGGVLLLGLTRPRPDSGTVRSRVLEVSLADQFALTGTPWPYVYAVAGLLVLAAAVLMTSTAARWPSRAARFERPGLTPSGQPTQPDPMAGPAPTGAAGDAQADEDPAVLWRMLDSGVDPTAADERVGDPVEEPADERTDEHDVELDGSVTSDGPDVHEQPPGVTMKPRVASRTDEPA